LGAAEQDHGQATDTDEKNVRSNSPAALRSGGPNARMTRPSQSVGRHPRSIAIANVKPEIDAGRWPAKREVGDVLIVEATLFKEGHDKLAAVVGYRGPGGRTWRETPMVCVNPGLDLWRGTVTLDRIGRWEFAIEAWADRYASWADEIGKKRAAGQDVSLELIEGRALVAAVAKRATGRDKARLAAVHKALKAESSDAAELLLDPALAAVMARWPDRSRADRYDRTLAVTVERVRARFAAWYEMFPRSQGTDPTRSATFAEAAGRLPEIAGLGFDVVYLPPIHPIGRAHRKGPNNRLHARPDDPGSPYAIGAAEGGHDAVHPDLGTLEDFHAFRRAAEELGMEIALDFAIQCAPDHPWVKEHPDWFQFRPDGTIRYAENPPKKYQDIVNVDFSCKDWERLWEALRDVVLFWAGNGVKTFRVDNPHTKPVEFWEWMIAEVKARHPDTVFLSEAFTRPPMLHTLAKAGFSQSYTYFTWRNFKDELTEYATELTETGDYLRPNFFTNTPDILHAFLQTGGRPAFLIRHALAATLSSLYGIYSGFEMCEGRAIAGTEEYQDSEKYQVRVWDWDRPGNIKAEIARINRIRRDNPALQEFENLRFYESNHDRILFYGKMTPGRDNMVFVAVNLDPFEAHEAMLEFPLAEMGMPDGEAFEVVELMRDETHLWEGPVHHWRFDPATNPVAIWRVTPWQPVAFRDVAPA
jgi:starch synthase (maltosyl-transferring)